MADSSGTINKDSHTLPGYSVSVIATDDMLKLDKLSEASSFSSVTEVSNITIKLMLS